MWESAWREMEGTGKIWFGGLFTQHECTPHMVSLLNPPQHRGGSKQAQRRVKGISQGSLSIDTLHTGLPETGVDSSGDKGWCTWTQVFSTSSLGPCTQPPAL